MSLQDPGMSLIEWRNSLQFDDPEEGQLFATYCNNLAGDSRFKRLLNFMEATATVNAIQAPDAEAREEARYMMEAVKKLRQAIQANIAALVVEDQKLAAEGTKD